MARRTARGPLAVLSDASSRTTGRDAQSMNIAAGRAVADAIRTTLGPMGMDKMLVDSTGNVVVTNDGVTLLEEMAIEHPAADLVVEVAETQEAEVGDGTTSAVVVAGALLSEAQDLVEEGIHPSTIVSGYRRAETLALEALDDLAVDVDPDDEETLERIAATALTGKGAETARDLLAGIVVEAVTAAAREDGTVDRDAIKVVTFYGQSLEESRFLPGATVGKNPPHPQMPTDFEDANVLVYEGAIERSELETDLDATVSDPDVLDEFAAREADELAEVVDRIVDAGADVVLADGAIDDAAQQRFADAGILALRRVRDEDRKRVAAATGAARLSDLGEIDPDDLGRAGRVHRERIRPHRHVQNADPERDLRFEDGAGADIGTIRLRGATRHVVEEVERAVEDAIDVVTAAIEDGAVLPGGGAPEAEAALRLRSAADAVDGREQLAVEAFADALDAIPRLLAENAGHDVIDALVELTARHDAGERTAGIDADTGEPVDALEAGVVEPHRVATAAVESAVDAATMLLRIDDVVSAGDLAVADDEDEEDEPGF